MGTFKIGQMTQRIFAIGVLAISLAIVGCDRKNEARITFDQQFEATIRPGDWQGFELGRSSSEKCVYLAKICPLELSDDGAHIDKYFIQPECGKTGWHDVIRIVLPPEQKSPIKVRVIVYKISGGVEPPTMTYK